VLSGAEVVLDDGLRDGSEIVLNGLQNPHDLGSGANAERQRSLQSLKQRGDLWHLLR
jgi:hypothetical protein